jgi:hypothetical protein
MGRRVPGCRPGTGAGKRPGSARGGGLLAVATAEGQPYAIAMIRLPRGVGRTVFLPRTEAAPRLLVRKGDLQAM